jgi:hypothetical protein
MRKSLIFLNLLVVVLISCQNNTTQTEVELIAGTGNSGFKDGLN